MAAWPAGRPIKAASFQFTTCTWPTCWIGSPVQLRCSGGLRTGTEIQEWPGFLTDGGVRAGLVFLGNHLHMDPLRPSTIVA